MVMPAPGMKSVIEGTQTLSDFIQDRSTQFEMHHTSGDDTCVIIYTSGTTGRPKGAELTHANLFLNTMITIDLRSAETEDVMLIVLPLFHIFGMTVVMNAGFYKGNTLVLVPRFDAEQVLLAMQQHSVTAFVGVPTMYWALLHYTDAKINFEVITKKPKQMRIGRCIAAGTTAKRF